MEGAHRGQRTLKEGVVGSKDEVTVQRRRAQNGAAAAGRRGQAVNVARAERELTKSKEDAAVEKEVVRAMKQGTALVQASLERLEGAERSWNKHVKDAGVRINSYPTEKQVLTYMATMSRQRQRMCLREPEKSSRV